MGALVLTAPNEFEIRDLPRPSPRDNEVLCRVRAIAICGTDAEIVEGTFKGRWPRAYPFVPGHEWSGEIVDAGEVARGFGFIEGSGSPERPLPGAATCRCAGQGPTNLAFNNAAKDPATGHTGNTPKGPTAGTPAR